MVDYHKETSRTLGSNGDYEGQTHDLSSDKYLLAFAIADVYGELKIEQSPDKNNWYVMEEESVQPNDPVCLVSEAVCQYARAIYENGSQIQNTFRLQTCTKGAR